MRVVLPALLPILLVTRAATVCDKHTLSPWESRGTEIQKGASHALFPQPYPVDPPLAVACAGRRGRRAHARSLRRGREPGRRDHPGRGHDPAPAAGDTGTARRGRQQRERLGAFQWLLRADALLPGQPDQHQECGKAETSVPVPDRRARVHGDRTDRHQRRDVPDHVL